MDNVIEITFLSLLYLTALGVYLWLLAKIVPKYLMRIEYDASYGLGRGLKKYTYPEGRAVVYEPHPSVRKYLNKQLLFTLDGYKYVQFKLDRAVKSYSAEVLCFDNKNKVIDLLYISEGDVPAALSCPVRLPHKTSYVATVLKSVNKKQIDSPPYMKTHFSKAYLYLGVVSVLTFLEFLHVYETVNGIVGVFDKTGFTVNRALFILPSVFIGAVCLFITLFARVKKGIKVIWK